MFLLRDVTFGQQRKTRMISVNQQLVLLVAMAIALTHSWYVVAPLFIYGSNQPQAAPDTVWATSGTHRIVVPGIDLERACKEEVGRDRGDFRLLCNEDCHCNWTNWIRAVSQRVSQYHPTWLSLLLPQQIGWFWTSWYHIYGLTSPDRWSPKCIHVRLVGGSMTKGDLDLELFYVIL